MAEKIPWRSQVSVGVAALLVLASLHSLPVSADEATSLNEPRVTKRHLVWRNQEHSLLAEALEIRRDSAEVQETHWKVLTPEGFRVSLLSTYEPESGTFLDRVRDLESGWFAELSLSSGTKTEPLTFNNLGSTMAEMAREKPLITVSLTTSDGFHRSWLEVFNEPQEQHGFEKWEDYFLAELISSGDLAEVPRSTKEELRFLASVQQHFGEPASLDFQLIGMLREALGSAEKEDDEQSSDYEASDWTSGTGSLGTSDDAESARLTFRELEDRFEEPDSGEESTTPDGI